MARPDAITNVSFTTKRGSHVSWALLRAFQVPREGAEHSQYRSEARGREEKTQHLRPTMKLFASCFFARSRELRMRGRATRFFENRKMFLSLGFVLPRPVCCVCHCGEPFAPSRAITAWKVRHDEYILKKKIRVHRLRVLRHCQKLGNSDHFDFTSHNLDLVG